MVNFPGLVHKNVILGLYIISMGFNFSCVKRGSVWPSLEDDVIIL